MLYLCAVCDEAEVEDCECCEVQVLIKTSSFTDLVLTNVFLHSMNIYVSNLNYRVNEDELRQLFEQYGEVTSAKVVMDRETGRSRGFGFVEMTDDGDGRKAIDALNEYPMGGRDIRVSEARPRPEGGGGGQRRDSFR